MRTSHLRTAVITSFLCLCVSLAPVVAQRNQSTKITLVRNGVPVHNMYCLPNDQAEPTAVQALKEYRDLVTKATGKEPQRVAAPVPGTPTIFFGRNPWSEKSGITTKDLASEGFHLKTVGQDIHIVGRDTPRVGAQRVEGNQGMEPGTLYGTYEFLEQAYGMLFAWHDDLGTVIPKHRNLQIDSLDVTDAPDCLYRQYTKSPDGKANEMYGRRLRLGHPIQVKHQHNWHEIMSPDIYGKAHPEWFAEIDGKRYPKHYAEKRGGQVCTSNPQVVDHFAKAAIDYFNKYPTGDMFSIAANDGRKFCTCKKCEALDDGRIRPDGKRVTTDRIITFSNQVAEQVAKVHPDKRLGVIIYLDYKYPPKNVKPNPMLFLVHPTNSGFAQGVDYSGDEWSESAQEQGWHAAVGKFYKYDIWHYDQTPLYMIAPVTKNIISKCRAQKDHGVDGGYHYIARSYELMGAGHYLLGRLMWDYDFDAETAEKKYYDALYGDAAPEVKEYYDFLEDSLIKTFKDGPGTAEKEPIVASMFERYPGLNNPGIYLAAYWPILNDAQEMINKALQKRSSMTPEQAQRLDRLVDHHDYTAHTVAAMIYAGRGYAGVASSLDKKGFDNSKKKRSDALNRIKEYNPSYVDLIAEMDSGSHTSMLFGQKPKMVIRAPSDFNE